MLMTRRALHFSVYPSEANVEDVSLGTAQRVKEIQQWMARNFLKLNDGKTDILLLAPLSSCRSSRWRVSRLALSAPRQDGRDGRVSNPLLDYRLTRHPLQLVYLLPRFSGMDVCIQQQYQRTKPHRHRWMTQLMVPEPSTKRLSRSPKTNKRNTYRHSQLHGTPVLFTEWPGVSEPWSYGRITSI